MVRRDFFDLTDDELDELNPIDLAWIDAGTPTDDARFLARLFPRVRPGGFVVMHEPTMTTPVRTSGGMRLRQVRSPVWEELCWRLDDSCELLVIPETVKYRQSGIGLLRRRTDDEIRFRTESFEDEMVALHEAPVRFDAVGVGAGRRERVSQQALVNVMSDARARAVYGCICAGISSMVDIGAQLDMTNKDVAKVVARLVSAGLVDNRDGLRDDPTAWQQHARHGERSMRGLQAASITDPEVLTLVARQFRAGRTYAEAEVSRICREFTDDFALLRRALVDAGLLSRSDGLYRRNGQD